MRKFTLLIAVLGLMFSSTAQNIPSYIPTDSLVGYWGFDGDANDYSGNGNNGTVNGATLTEDRDGNANSAYSFDGVSDVISFYPNDSSIISQSSDFTWSLWFSSPTNDFNGPFLNVGSWFCKLGHDSPGLFFKDELGNQTNTWYVQQHFNYFPEVNTWHNLVIMKSGNNVTLLIDNVTIGSMQTWGFSNFNNSNLVQFGYYCCNVFFNGKLDDIGIWNRALSEEEIQAIYTGESSADNSGNSFSSVVIGEQEWMSENLRTTHYANGDPIPHITSNSQWTSSVSGAYCWYDNDSLTYENSYGKLYNWYAVNDSRNICPAGWHVPSDAEWTVLADFLASSGYEGNEGTALKAINGWNDSGNGTDDFGFGGLPGGRRTGTPIFIDFGNNGAWWCSDSDIGNQYAIFRTLHKNSTILSSDQFERKYGR